MSPVQSIQGVSPSAATVRVASRPQPRGRREAVQNEPSAARGAQGEGASDPAPAPSLGGRLDITA